MQEKFLFSVLQPLATSSTQAGAAPSGTTAQQAPGAARWASRLIDRDVQDDGQLLHLLPVAQGVYFTLLCVLTSAKISRLCCVIAQFCVSTIAKRSQLCCIII